MKRLTPLILSLISLSCKNQVAIKVVDKDFNTSFTVESNDEIKSITFTRDTAGYSSIVANGNTLLKWGNDKDTLKRDFEFEQVEVIDSALTEDEIKNIYRAGCYPLHR